jgi:hypothetical protein
MKTKLTILVVALAIFGYGFYVTKSPSEVYQAVASAVTATSTVPTRLEQTQKLIDALTEQRLKDETFITETNKQVESLKIQRNAQARLDALMIVKTQLDVEISNLEAIK